MWWIVFGIAFLFGVTALTGAPYVPSRRKDVARAFRALYPMGEKDTLVDLGSGGGGVLRAARARGATVFGVELNPILVACSRIRSWKDAKLTVVCRDMYAIHFPLTTTVVYVFGDSRDIKKMTRKIAQQATILQRPLALISYGFEIPGKTALKKVGAHMLYEITPETSPSGRQ